MAAGLIGASQALYIVDQREQAILLQFGQPIGEVKGPGLHAKIPFIQNVSRFDRRILSVDPAPEQVVISSASIERPSENTEEDAENAESENKEDPVIGNVTGEPIILDTFARYKIIDPLRFLKTLRTVGAANSRLSSSSAC